MSIESLLQVDLLLQVRGMTPGRAAAMMPVAAGLISVIMGWVGLTRSADRISSGQLMAIVALAAGLAGIVLSGLHLVRATGGIGTGSGKLGAMVALMLGVIGMVLGGLALARSRRISRRISTTGPDSLKERG